MLKGEKATIIFIAHLISSFMKNINPSYVTYVYRLCGIIVYPILRRPIAVHACCTVLCCDVLCCDV